MATFSKAVETLLKSGIDVFKKPLKRRLEPEHRKAKYLIRLYESFRNCHDSYEKVKRLQADPTLACEDQLARDEWKDALNALARTFLDGRAFLEVHAKPIADELDLYQRHEWHLSREYTAQRMESLIEPDDSDFENARKLLASYLKTKTKQADFF
jgi:hypothetical protein